METVSKAPRENVGRDISMVVGTLLACAVATAAVAHYCIDAKEAGDYVAVVAPLGIPLTIGFGLIASELDRARQYVSNARKYLGL